MKKICSRCGEEKNISEFHSWKTNGEKKYGSNCRKCYNRYHKEYNRARSENDPVYRKKKSKDGYKSIKKRRENDPVFRKKQSKASYKSNKTRRENDPVYREKHNRAGYKSSGKRRRNDPVFRLRCSLRARLRLAIKGNWKSGRTLELLGCSIDDFKEYLENLFTEEMTWDNYGEWEMDHIKPCASFDLSKAGEQKKCFHYTNFQPLWAKDNLRKSNKYKEVA